MSGSDELVCLHGRKPFDLIAGSQEGSKILCARFLCFSGLVSTFWTLGGLYTN